MIYSRYRLRPGPVFPQNVYILILSIVWAATGIFASYIFNGCAQGLAVEKQESEASSGFDFAFQSTIQKSSIKNMDNTIPLRITLDHIIANVLKTEGGYNPSDPSYNGITQVAWDDFRRAKPGYYREIQTIDNLQAMPPAVRDLVVHNFYRWYIGDLSGAADVPSWFAYPLADFFVESHSYAIMPLQRRANSELGDIDLKVDGVWGTNTKKAVNQLLMGLTTAEKQVEFIDWYMNNRREFIKSLHRSDEVGILNRISKVETLSLMHIEVRLPPHDVLLHSLQP